MEHVQLREAYANVRRVCRDDWLAYQTHLAQMERIYYFDMPIRYRELTDAFPSVIQIRPFQELFTEITTVVGR